MYEDTFRNLLPHTIKENGIIDVAEGAPAQDLLSRLLDESNEGSY